MGGIHPFVRPRAPVCIHPQENLAETLDLLHAEVLHEELPIVGETGVVQCVGDVGGRPWESKQVVRL